MDASSIISGYCNHVFRNKQSNRVFPNIYFGNYEADILEITKSGYSYEFEVKISKSDFKNDAKKSCGWIQDSSTNFIRKQLYKFDQIREGKRVNYFSYMVPEGLISVEDVPDFAGLVYVSEGMYTYYSKEKGYYHIPKININTVKLPPKLTKEKFDKGMLFQCLEKSYYRYHDLRRELERKYHGTNN